MRSLWGSTLRNRTGRCSTQTNVEGLTMVSVKSWTGAVLKPYQSYTLLKSTAWLLNAVFLLLTTMVTLMPTTTNTTIHTLCPALWSWLSGGAGGWRDSHRCHPARHGRRAALGQLWGLQEFVSLRDGPEMLLVCPDGTRSAVRQLDAAFLALLWTLLSFCCHLLHSLKHTDLSVSRALLWGHLH